MRKKLTLLERREIGRKSIPFANDGDKGWKEFICGTHCKENYDNFGLPEFDDEIENYMLNFRDYIFRFSELFDGENIIDNLVEKIYGVPYIDIKFKTQKSAENRFKKVYPTIKSYKLVKHFIDPVVNRK